MRAHRKSGEPCGERCHLGEELEWKRLGNPTGIYSSFNSQPTFVAPVTDALGNPYLVYLGDNWLRAGPRGLQDAGYVWLPLKFREDGAITISAYTNWSLASPFSAITEHSQEESRDK